MTRLKDWTVRLEAFLAQSRSRKFSYGEFDCCLFCAGAIEAMTGVDLGAPFRGHYRSMAGAMEVARVHAGAPTVDAIAGFLAAKNGIAEIMTSHASRGDMVLLDWDGGALGIVALNGRHCIAPTPLGLTEQVPLSWVVRAWKI